MARLVVVTFGFFMVVLLQCAAAQIFHVVGDAIGWSIPKNNDDYATWARSKNFHVGDILTFKFESKLHNVYEVLEKSYDACSTADSIGDMIQEPGNMTLDTAGEHYYICSQHCQDGQKLAINVLSSADTPRSSSAPPTTPTTPSTPSSSSKVLTGTSVPIIAVILGLMF